MASSNPYLLTLPQLMTAKKKIGNVSAFFDPKKTSLQGFESTVLTPTQFREQLRRNLCINVTDAELGALVTLFDKTGDGLVDSLEFKNEFFRLGKQTRAKFMHEKSEEAKRIAVFKDKQRQIKEKKFENFSHGNVATTWTEEQESSALRKLANAAFGYDPLKGGLRGFFDCSTMTAIEFKDLMRRNFEVYLTPEETGALLSMFDREGTGQIDCKEFVYQFFRIGRSEKDSHFSRNLNMTHEMQKMKQDRMEETVEKYVRGAFAKMTPASEKDKYTAFEKIRSAAIHYKGDSAFSGNLRKSFESESLNPTAFKVLLKSNFEIILSPGELDAVVKMFDVEGDGNVSTVEFITTFFRIALNERSHLVQMRKEQQIKAKQEWEEMAKSRVTNALDKIATRVVWPVLPNEDGEQNESMDREQQQQQQQRSPVVGDAKSILRNRGRASMSDILSPVKGAGKSSGPLAALFPKASQDTKDFLKSLELQEREIKLMSSQARRDRAINEELSTNTNTTSSHGQLQQDGKKRKLKKAGAKKGAGGSKSTHSHASSTHGMHSDVQIVGDEEVIEEEGQSLMDRSWGFAEGGAVPATQNLDFGSRPGTSAGGHGGASRGMHMGGLSSSSSRILPVGEEFGSGDIRDIPIEVEDERNTTSFML